MLPQDRFCVGHNLAPGDYQIATGVSGRGELFRADVGSIRDHVDIFLEDISTLVEQ